MGLKTYFTGKTGMKFWSNIVAMLLVLIAVPALSFYLLGVFTHHGEKIEVPSVMGKTFDDAEMMLEERDLVCMVADSTFDKHAAPGVVLDQTPKAGYEVKAGRVIYVTLNLRGEPMVKVPRLDGSLREIEAALKATGFKLTPHEIVMGRDKNLVIGVKQGSKMIFAGSMASKEKPVTIIVGGGEMEEIDSFAYAIDDSVYTQDNDSTNDFDIEL